MSFERPDWSAPAHVQAVSTTRSGYGLGSSLANYGSLNLGTHVGDELKRVRLNRAALKKKLALPNEPNWLDQVHGVEVLDATQNPSDSAPTADAAYSNEAGVVCAVMTADCLPLLLTNNQGTEVAAVHAGWRGMATGVIENTVAKFSSAAEEIIAWAGPCIGPKHFEIGTEVREQLGGPSGAYVELANRKLLANLNLLAQHRLAALGVGLFSHSSACTFSEPERFFSYRRDGQCGRMASLIWLEAGL